MDCPVVLGALAQAYDCGICASEEGRFPIQEAKTPLRPIAPRLTPEDIESTILRMLDNPRVRERLAEAVANVLREYVVRQKGSFVWADDFDIDDP